MYSIVSITKSISNELQSLMDKVTLRWKGSDQTSEYIEKKPTVYAYTYDDLSNGMPLNTPSILIQCMSLDDSGLASFLVHVCICNPARQDKEITKPVQGSNDTYEYGTQKTIDSAGVRSELYRACMMLGEHVYIALKRMSNSDRAISNVNLETPNPYLENFPYCECSVSFDVNCSQTETKTNSKLWDLL